MPVVQPFVLTRKYIHLKLARACTAHDSCMSHERLQPGIHSGAHSRPSLHCTCPTTRITLSSTRPALFLRPICSPSATPLYPLCALSALPRTRFARALQALCSPYKYFYVHCSCARACRLCAWSPWSCRSRCTARREKLRATPETLGGVGLAARMRAPAPAGSRGRTGAWEVRLRRRFVHLN